MTIPDSRIPLSSLASHSITRKEPYFALRDVGLLLKQGECGLVNVGPTAARGTPRSGRADVYQAALTYHVCRFLTSDLAVYN